MITVCKPNTLSTLNPNDKFMFNENISNIFYFISKGVGGFTFWNDTKKEILILNPNYEEYQKIIINKIN